MCWMKATENTKHTLQWAENPAKIRSSIIIKNSKLFGQFSACLDSKIHGCSQAPLPTQQCLFFFFFTETTKNCISFPFFTYLHFNLECFINFIIKLILLTYFRLMLLILQQEEKKLVLLKRKKSYLKAVEDTEMTKTVKPLVTSSVYKN